MSTGDVTAQLLSIIVVPRVSFCLQTNAQRIHRRLGEEDLSARKPRTILFQIT